MRYCLGVFFLIFANAAMAWDEPARSTADRAGLMDALRPHAVWMLGPPVEFVVHELRRAGNVGFASVSAQRPGGGQIDISRTPGAARGQLDVEYMDGSSLQALYLKSGDTWVAVHWAIGATDAWFADPVFCPDYHTVIPEFCGD